jgi:RimJ/RimL family protein N-acetyltransferase
MKILETERLVLREIDSADDAEFILELLNSPGFIKYIGDRGVRTVEQSKDFIDGRLRKSYTDNGFGLYAVELTADGTRLGICGFVKRDGLDHADIGFAFLPEFEKKGYAVESARAVMEYGRTVLGLERVLAITSPDNEGSGRLLEKLAFTFDKLITLPNGDEQVKLFVSEPQP